MDNTVMVCFASVIATMTALCFMELRRIRRRLEGTSAPQAAKSQAPAAG
jgi:hypothetical protein